MALLDVYVHGYYDLDLTDCTCTFGFLDFSCPLRLACRQTGLNKVHDMTDNTDRLVVEFVHIPHGDLWLFFEGWLWTQTCKTVVEPWLPGAARSPFAHVSRYKGRWLSAEMVPAVWTLFPRSCSLQLSTGSIHRQDVTTQRFHQGLLHPSIVSAKQTDTHTIPNLPYRAVNPPCLRTTSTIYISTTSSSNSAYGTRPVSASTGPLRALYHNF